MSWLWNDVYHGPVSIPRGGFIEDTFGQVQMHTVKTEGVDTLLRYGCYVMNFHLPVVTHIDGMPSPLSYQ